MAAISTPESSFKELGLKQSVANLIREIQELYVADSIPWVVGYSGGKDSTAALQLVWSALQDISPEKRHKTVHVISTDTLVENPIVAAWVNQSLIVMRDSAEREALPIIPHRLTPEIRDSFWVNLIGKGYPAPRPKFRWCTERLKINPANRFVTSVVKESGETILVLGVRTAESSARASTMKKHARWRTRERLSPSSSLANCLIYSPIEEWSNDDVWLYLMQTPNPWGYNNKDLLTMYQGASPDGECPLVVDSSTPSCGDSRFGCWVCTLVEKDKSMSAMIQNDEEKEWMLPLLEIRNELDQADDRHLRDFRRMNGLVQIFSGRNVPGPYTQTTREHWLRRILGAQTWIRRNGPAEIKSIELISFPELNEIRRIWVTEKHELEDSLPKIYEETTGEQFPQSRKGIGSTLGSEEIDLLRAICGPDHILFELTRELISVEERYKTYARRSGLFEALEKSLRRNFYDDERDAVDLALRKQAAKSSIRTSESSI